MARPPGLNGLRSTKRYRRPRGRLEDDPAGSTCRFSRAASVLRGALGQPGDFGHQREGRLSKIDGDGAADGDEGQGPIDRGLPELKEDDRGEREDDLCERDYSGRQLDREPYVEQSSNPAWPLRWLWADGPDDGEPLKCCVGGILFQ